MGYKKHNWMSYGRKGSIVDITIKDEDSRKIDRFICNSQKDYKKVLRLIKQKFGYDFEPEISKEESINKEINWLKDDSKW